MFASILLLSICLFGWATLVVAQVDSGDKEQGDQQTKDGEIEDDEEPAPTPSPPPEDMRDEDGFVSLDFSNTDIHQIVKTMSEMTGRNFIIDRSVSGSVTIISPTKVTPQEAYDIFLSVLKVNGFTTVEVGKITKIIPAKDAVRQPIPTKTGGVPRGTDQIITQLIPLENIDSNDVANSFRGLIGPDGDIFAYGPSNMVVVSDAASNVNRLYRIIKQLDTKGAEQKIETIILTYADAETTAQMIMELLEEDIKKSRRTTRSYRRTSRRKSRRKSRRSRRSRSSRRYGSSSIPSMAFPVILADTRTNSLIIKSNQYQMERIKEIITKLDHPLPGGEGKIHVIYLENADAEELAVTLGTLTGNGAGRTSRRRSTMQRGRISRGRRTTSRTKGRYSTKSGGRPGIASTTGRLFASFDGEVRITADPPTNSLLIIANPRDFKILQEVIENLDIPRRQVFVEAVIMEITMERGLDLGFEFRSTNDPAENGIQVIGGTNYGGIQNATANPMGVSGFAMGMVDGDIPILGYLFKSSKQKTEKTNLLLFLTPYVIKDASDLEEVTRMSNERMNIFREQNRNPVRSDMEDHFINEDHMSPTENIFRPPRQGTVETDPNLRKQKDSNEGQGENDGEKDNEDNNENE